MMEHDHHIHVHVHLLHEQLDLSDVLAEARAITRALVTLRRRADRNLAILRHVADLHAPDNKEKD